MKRLVFVFILSSIVYCVVTHLFWQADDEGDIQRGNVFASYFHALIFRQRIVLEDGAIFRSTEAAKNYKESLEGALPNVDFTRTYNGQLVGSFFLYTTFILFLMGLYKLRGKITD